MIVKDFKFCCKGTAFFLYMQEKKGKKRFYLHMSNIFCNFAPDFKLE